jgi:hypothetical protein
MLRALVSFLVAAPLLMPPGMCLCQFDLRACLAPHGDECSALTPESHPTDCCDCRHRRAEGRTCTRDKQGRQASDSSGRRSTPPKPPRQPHAPGCPAAHPEHQLQAASRDHTVLTSPALLTRVCFSAVAPSPRQVRPVDQIGLPARPPFYISLCILLL